jgi:hypothetical protein
MARKEINIGIEGNDGTGDPIREAFSKVNENFRELYSSLGLGEALTFIGLSDTPNTILEADDNKVLVVDGVNETIIFKELIGSSTIIIDQVTVDGQPKIRINSLASALINDPAPTLSRFLDANAKKIQNLENPEQDQDAVTKIYADTKLSIAGIDAIDPETNQQNVNWGTMTGPLILSRNPIDSDDINFEGKIAATKAYVDSKSYSSAFTLYVATNGDDVRAGVPESQIGRSPAASYKTIQKALEVAEQLIAEAPLELGPYQKTLTYNNGTEVCTLFSIVESPLSGRGAKGVARLGLNSYAITATGSGYIPGQELTLVGGTFSVPAKLEVISTNFAGAITSLNITDPGIYSQLPDPISNMALQGGANTGAAISGLFKVVSVVVTDEGGSKPSSISGATKAQPVVITTSTDHDYETGDYVEISDVGGMVELNGNEYYIDVLTPTTFALYFDEARANPVNGTGYGTFTSSGTVIEGRDFGSASVIFSGGGGSGAEARTTEVGGLIREITVVSGGSGYSSFPTLEIYLPRLLIETDNKGTDFFDDLREGQLIRGTDSRALCRIISHDGSRVGGREIFDVEFLTGVFDLGETLQYADAAIDRQVLVLVETGIYYENFPLRLAANVSLRGGDFRRTIIRPKPGVSESPWSRLFFRRDPVIDGIRVTPVEYGYHYLTDPLDFSSTPKNNDEMDVFLCNDATRVYDMSCQGHGGFNMVLDPEGQILSKSPYYQVGSSFSKSINQKIFAGGQFVDGFVGNLPGILLTDLEGRNDRVLIGGLDREPELPTSFIIDGEIFRISLVNKLETEFFSAKLLLEANRRFIQEEVIAFVNLTYPDLVYDQAKCFRDVGLIVDSVIEDVLFGGYANSAQAGRLYFSNGSTVVSGQVLETVAAINEAKRFAVAAVEQVVQVPRNTNGISQVTINTITDGGTSASTVEQCFDIIANIVRRGEDIYSAKNLLQQNKEYIQQEVIRYIDETYVFDYNETDYRSDFGYMLEALRYDLMFNSNFLTVQSALVYYRAYNLDKITGIEKTALLGTLADLRSQLSTLLVSNATARTRTLANIDTIVNIVTNGTSVVPSYSFPAATGYNTSYLTGYGDARAQLVANKEFIKAEITAWIAVQVAAGTPPFSTAFRYDSTKCARDVGYIVDALLYDLSYGGNLATQIAGRAYYDGALSQLGFGQKDETLAAYARLKTVVGQIILETPVTKSTGNALNQNTAGTAGSAGSATFAQTRIQEIVDVIDVDGDVDDAGYPAEVVPDTTWVASLGTGLVTASDLINTNESSIIDNLIDFLDDEYLANTLTYNSATCKRDVGYVVDALSIDIFGDFNNSVRAGYSYYSKGNRYIPADQLPATLDAFEYVKTLALNIVKSEAPSTIRTVQTFAPVTAINQATNIFTIPNHGFTSGSRVVYSNGGGTTIPTQDNKLVDGGIYYLFVIDGQEFKVFENFDLLVAAERTETEGLEIDIVNTAGVLDYLGTNHSFSFHQVTDPALTLTDLNAAGVVTAINTGMGYINTILSGGDSTAVPSIYPQYECILDTPYNYAYPTKVILGTAGNKSMLANDYTQINDMGYGIFCTNNGLSEQVSTFTYYCYTAFYALNGAQIRSLNGSSAHGVFALRSEGADPVEIPDRVSLKFPVLQTANAYANVDLDIQNLEEALELYVTNYQYLPLAGGLVDINHTGDPGAPSRLGVETYTVSSVSTENLPSGVALLGLAATGTPVGLKLDIPVGKPIIIRCNDEVVLAGKENIVATRPSTALIWDENRTNVTRVLSFATFIGQDAVEADVTTTSRDGFDYVSMVIPRENNLSIQPSGHGGVGDTRIAVDTLNFTDAERLLFPTTGQMIYDGSTIGTGGMIFGWGDSVYEITGYEVINPGDPENEYGRVTFRNVTTTSIENPSGGLTQAITGVPGNFEIYAGLRSGATGDVTVNISTMRATGHDFLEIGTGSYADTNYPSNIYGPPRNAVVQDNEAVEVGKGRVFYVSTDQSGNFRVGELFGIDQGTGVVDLGARISLTNVQALRLKAGAQVVEFSTDITLGGTGPAANDQVPTENAVRTYIDKRLGLRHTGGLLGTGLIGPGFLPLDGTLGMKAPIDMDDFTIQNLPLPDDDRDAVPKDWVRLANLQDAPADWLDSTPAFNTTDAQILAFTGTNANFINVTVDGAITFTRSSRTLTATINDNVIVNADVNSNAAIEQSKLSMLLASARSGAPTGTAAAKQAASGLSSFDNTFFNATDGYVSLPKSTSLGTPIAVTLISVGTRYVIDGVGTTTQLNWNTIAGTSGVTYGPGDVLTAQSVGTGNGTVRSITGIDLSRLSGIDPTVIHVTDNSLLSTSGKVLGRRRGDSVGPIVPIDFRTVIEDGDGLARNEVPSLGVVARTVLGTGAGKFSTINYGNANNVSHLVQRDGVDGGFSAGTITAASVGATGSITTSELRLSSNTTTQKSMDRLPDVLLSGDFYTMIYDGNGGIGIRLNSSVGGSGDTLKNYTEYYATEHRFRDNVGSAAGGTINLGTGGNLSTGSQGNAGNIIGQWSLVGTSRMQATWADLAEYYTADHDYQPGTVLIFGGEAEVTTTNTKGDTRVAGVVSENPAFLMNQECPGTRIALALQGRVPCQVMGKVKKGDLMITGPMHGVAIAAKNGKASVGSVIGKALSDYDSEEIGLIEVAVGRL